jgi:O-antigen/teichoic acid export membrane protein
MRLPALAQRMAKSRFIVGVATLSSGTVLGQLLTFVALPVVARLYSPEQMGNWAVFVAIGTFVGTLSSLSYDMAVTLPKAESDGKSVAWLAQLLTLCLSAIILVVTWTFSGPLARAVETPSLEPVFWLLSVAVWNTGTSLILGQWMIRKERFRTMAAGQVAATVFTVVARVAYGTLFGGDEIALVYIFIGSVFVQLLVLSRQARRDELLEFRPEKGRKEALREVAREYRSFPLLMSWSRLLNAGSQHSIVLVLGILYGPVVIGLYHLGRRILNSPLQVLSRSVGQVFLHRASHRAHGPDGILRDFRLITGVLFLGGVVPFALVALAATPVLAWFLGEEWRDSGPFVQAMTPWLFMGLVAQPAITTMIVLKRLREKLVWEVLLTIARTSALFVGYFVFESALASVFLFSVVGAAFCAALVVLAHHFARKDKDERSSDSAREHPGSVHDDVPQHHKDTGGDA